MKNTHRLFCQISIIAVFLILLSSCKKDDDDNIITDVDGNVYHSLIIGTQTWMVENLRTTRYNDNTPIPNVTDGTGWDTLTTPAYCWYNNDTANKAIYGALYNGYTIKTGKIAPKGWHIPAASEWTTLETFLIANRYNYDGTTTDNKIGKALASATGWESTNVPGSIGNTDYPEKRNLTGFTAVPSGFRGIYGTFFEVGGSCDYWSSSGFLVEYPFRGMRNFESSLDSYNFLINDGLSIRCVKD